ncbi:MAG: single-stranded-DNA-specific exonuclease RecJ [Candidatus Limivivens sp.]|nr:single-stranded-DNA-specific exonuclease RecJ [Candidatus Limivivens sp.]
MEKWVVAAKRADFKAISKKFGIDQVTARLIRNREVVGDEAIEEYLNGGLERLHDGRLLLGCGRAVSILQEKIRAGKAIRIIGDYDIDGVNATYILYRGLVRCGARVDYEIPDRMKDGYGINENLIRLACAEGIDTILTCDNGIAAVDQIALAKELGMTVVVTDHHEPQERLPRADAIVNPKQAGCPYPFKSLCGAAVALKVIQCLYEACGLDTKETEEFLEEAAVATVGDVMDLTGENRILVKEGLKRLNETKNPGFRALIQANGLDHARLTAYHIGFVLGPCINASGRLDTAKRALKLLLEEDPDRAAVLAKELKALNDERKDMTARGVEEAVQMIEEGPLKQDRVLVVYLPACHESLAGIIAGRLRERYYRPTIVITDSAEGIKGSGRSIESYNMFAELMKCKELFTRFGGHPMAAGLSMEKGMDEELRKRLNEQATLTEEDLTPKIVIDVPMPIDYITEDLIRELSVLEPFGKGNTKPVFAEKGLSLLNARILGQNQNVLKLQVQNPAGKILDALYFGDIGVFREYLEARFGHGETEKLFQGRENGITLSLTYYPSVNEYRDRKTIQIVIQNYQ